jgi:DNA repair exonuclease SbcCD ATPase subunit
MTRKRISDLLREEVKPQKEELSVPSPGELPTPAETGPLAPALPTPSPELPSTSAIAEESNLPQIEASIDRLNQELSQEKAQVSQLQEQLTEQKALVKTLTTDLSQANKHQQSLEVAQQKIQDLNQQIKLLEPLKQDLESQQILINKLYAEIQTLQTTLEKAQATPPDPIPANNAFALVLPTRYVAPGQPDTHLSNEDIGWFD